MTTQDKLADAIAARDAAIQQAQIWKMEAQSANATIAEIYRLVGSKAGNWNGANPVREALTEHDAQPAPAHVQVDDTRCNCPGGAKPDPLMHAPNCPVRTAMQPALAALRQPVPDAVRELPGKWCRRAKDERVDDAGELIATILGGCANELQHALAQQESRNAD